MEKNPCLRCAYSNKGTNLYFCEYILVTGHRRPCPGGVGCTVRTTLKGVKPSMARKCTWDKAEAQRLLEQGKSFTEIAEAVGATPGAIRCWASRAKKQENRFSLSGDGPAPEPEASQEAAQVTSQDLAIDTRHNEPVEISFKRGGCEVSLVAPDADTAIWAAKRLAEMVNVLRREQEE